MAEKNKGLEITDYRPTSKMVTKVTRVDQPRFPVIDGHSHLGEDFGGSWDQRPVEELLDVMDEADVRVFIDMDGGWGEEIMNHHIDHFKAKAPERFIHVGGVDWSQWEKHKNKFGEWAAQQFKAQIARGADAFKVWKNFGLTIEDDKGEIVAVNDERMDPVWAMGAELEVPIVVHIADPVAFFDPVNERNERWEELHAHPDWQFPSPPFPSFESLVEGFADVVLRHPETTFVGAHVGCYAENLGWVADLLDRAPNFHVDFAARIAELGRQPYTARRFMLDYADRIIFGTDLPADVDMYRLHYRFLETDDEYFDYSLDPLPPQGRWQIYGLHLPDEVLEKIYHLNAQRVFKIDELPD